MLDCAPNFDNIDFNGGNLSSDGGSILMLQFFRNIGIQSKLKTIPYEDHRSLPLYSNHEIQSQLICRSMLGYFNQADQAVLKNDPLLSLYFTPCSQSTVSRYFDRVTNKTNIMMKEEVTKLACAHVNKYVQEPIIDADSTLVETYGKQEASEFIHHYNEVGFHPLLINEFNSMVLLSALLRTGSAYSSNGIIGELKTVLAHMYNRGTIRFRGDSAFYDTELLKYLEDEGITYYVRAKGFTALKRASLEDMVAKDIDWWQYSANHPYYGELRYEIGQSGIKRRVVYKAYSIMENGQISLLPVVYAVVTNDEEKEPKEVMDFYEQRGASENFTKEFKNDFDAKHLSHSDFFQNEMEFLISAMAYNLFHIFQNQILRGADQNITMNTFRLMFQKVAVKVIRHARKISLSFSSAYSNAKQFMKYWNLVLQI